jgi:hypothetical protein
LNLNDAKKMQRMALLPLHAFFFKGKKILLIEKE